MDELRYALRRALISAGLGEKVIEAFERIVIECIRRSSELLPLFKAVSHLDVARIGQVLARVGCISYTSDNVWEALEVLDRFMRREY